MLDLLIVGAGGVGVEYAWVAGEMNLAAERAGAAQPWRIRGFADDAPGKKGEISGAWPVLGTVEEAATELAGASVVFAIAVGNNLAREQLVRRAEALGWRAGTLIHPSVVIAADAQIGEGCYLAPGSVICPQARLGNHVIVNIHASIGHHSVLEDYSQICPGARVSGACRVGKYGFLGSNASLNPRVSVGEGGVVGANSHAIRNVPAGATVFGVPAMSIGMSERKTSEQDSAKGDRRNG